MLLLELWQLSYIPPIATYAIRITVGLFDGFTRMPSCLYMLYPSIVLNNYFLARMLQIVFSGELHLNIYKTFDISSLKYLWNCFVEKLECIHLELNHVR